MSKLPALTGKEVISALKKAGFVVERQRGSHIFQKFSRYSIYIRKIALP